MPHQHTLPNFPQQQNVSTPFPHPINDPLPPPPQPPQPQTSAKVSAIHKGADALLAFMLDERSKAIAKVEEYYHSQLQQTIDAWNRCEKQLVATERELELSREQHEREKSQLEDQLGRREQVVKVERERQVEEPELLAKALEESDIVWDGRALTFGHSWAGDRSLSAPELKSFIDAARNQAQHVTFTNARLARLEASLGFAEPSQQPNLPPQIPQKRDSMSEDAQMDMKRMKLDDAAQSMPSPVASPRVAPKIISPLSKPATDFISAPQPSLIVLPSEPSSVAMNIDQHQTPLTPSTSLTPLEHNPPQPGSPIVVQRGPRSKIPMPGFPRKTG